MGGKAGKQSKQNEYKSVNNNFFVKQMINSHKTQSINDEYTFLGKLGQGTYAQVTKAKSKISDRVCAIKKVEKAKAPGIEIMLNNQFSILRELDHPNIIKIYSMYEDYKNFYIVSQLIQGNELFDYFKEKKVLEEKEACQIFCQVALAVNYLHLNHIIHRDIKLENVIYDQKSKILKLVDFGSAYEFQNNELINLKCVGTVTYLAPQVIKKSYNYKCDIWSLGVFLYILLGGYQPFAGKDQAETFEKIANDKVAFDKPVWEKVPNQAKKLIESMLQKSPEKRISMDKVLTNKWIVKHKHSQNISYEDQSFLMIILKRLSSFRNIRLTEIQLGVLVFMANFIISFENEEQLIRCFHLIDYEGDGVITANELVQCMVECADKPQKIAEKEASQIMKKIDFNNSKDISYSEFLVASASLESILTAQNLEKTFRIIDTDNSGKLSAVELKSKLGQQFDEQYYAKLIMFFDQDKDGQISFQEFKKMMRNILIKEKI